MKGRPPWSLARDPLGPALERVAKDRIHGASALAEEALTALHSAAQRWSRVGPAELAYRLRVVSRRWARVQPAMGFFVRTAHELGDLARSPRAVRSRTRRWLAEERTRRRVERARLVHVALRELPAHSIILTLSHSSAVKDVIVAGARQGRAAAVTVLRSLPGGEGRILVRELRNAGVSARLVPDDPLPAGPIPFTIVLLGADGVFSKGALVHKVGTRRLVTWARRRSIPVIALVESSKVAFPHRGPVRLPPLFDRTPGHWVSAYWTDAGVRASAWGPAHRAPRGAGPRGP